MKEQAKILRGEAWAARLQGHLAVPPNNMDDWMAQHTHRVKVDAYSASGLLRLGGGLSHLKFYAHKSALRRVLTRVSSHRAVRAFVAAGVLRSSGVAVPRPRACLRISDGFLLLTKGIEGSETLEYLWLGGIAEDLASHLMWSAGVELAQVHQAGYCHGDYKWNNLLWGRERLYLIDLDATRPCKAGSPKMMRDLARFTVDAERLDVSEWLYQRFFKGYSSVIECEQDELESRMMPWLKKLRSRHWKRYGTYTQRLV